MIDESDVSRDPPNGRQDEQRQDRRRKTKLTKMHLGRPTHRSDVWKNELLCSAAVLRSRESDPDRAQAGYGTDMEPGVRHEEHSQCVGHP